MRPQSALCCLQVRRKIQEYESEQQQHQQGEPSWSESCFNPSLLLVFDDTVCLTLFVCEAFLWRGVWNLNATFMLSDLFLGGWVNHAAGTVVLMVLQLFSYVGICGCARDDDVPSDEGKKSDGRPTGIVVRYLCDVWDAA